MITELFPAQSMSYKIASSASPSFIENMLPLDVLAAVASQTLRNEITPSPGREKISTENKKWFKKSLSSDHFTLDEVRALPTKSLVLKFSEMKSDELTKKYSYKCMLIPEKCTVVYKSFGNEKKAFDKIKDHLLHHVAHLMTESESKGSKNKFFTSVPLFPTKCTEKSPKRSSLKVPKKQQALLTKVLPNTESRTVFKTTKRKSTYVVNKLKKKFSKDFPSLNHFDTRKMEKTVVKKGTNHKFSFEAAEKKSRKSPQQKSVYRKLNDSVDLSPSTTNGSYNKFTPVQNEEECESNVQIDPNFDALYEACVSVYDDIMTKEKAEQEIKKEPGTSLLESDDHSIVTHDHTYAAIDEAKKNEKLSHEVKRCASETQKFVPGVKRFTVPSQLIIKTPPFPFVHTPLLPDLAEIKEIGMNEVDCSENMLQSEGDSSFIRTKVKSEKFSDEDSRIDSASVLECVENRVNVKQTNSISSKNSFTAAENDENLENMQKCEKELALKYIAKLYAKKKKQSNGSLICQICKDKYFTAQATLIHHYRSHAGIKPYTCNICSSTFTRQHSLNYHMLIHQNLSRFTCAHCGRTFRHPSHYKEHLRRHTGEAPFHCRDCDLHFKTRNTFKRHLRTRHQKLLTSHGLKDMSSDSSP
ncbi:zinc finger protein 732-like [Uloborus diversus]|uniref:zinc finger protein 732-like n=1 Tax=Uloborus diversus TaxID=327109 RepID=UPI002409A439|nr:zinc finger protein 732-like [Uloborus diversus]